MQSDNSVHVHAEIVWMDSNANAVPRPREVVRKGKKNNVGIYMGRHNSGKTLSI